MDLLAHLPVPQGITYAAGVDAVPVGWSDSAFNDDKATGRSTGGCIVGFQGSGPIIAVSKRLQGVALSSCEAELKMMTETVKKICWLRNIMKEIHLEVKEPTLIWEDNKGAIDLNRSESMNPRTAHIALRWFFCREKMMDGTARVDYCNTKRMVADILTKPLPKPAFEFLRKGMLEGKDLSCVQSQERD